MQVKNEIHFLNFSIMKNYEIDCLFYIEMEYRLPPPRRPKAHYYAGAIHYYDDLPHFCVKPWEFPANFSEKEQKIHLHRCVDP